MFIRTMWNLHVERHWFDCDFFVNSSFVLTIVSIYSNSLFLFLINFYRWFFKINYDIQWGSN